MDDAPYKAAIALICVPVADQSPIPKPPFSGEESGLVCPACFGMDGAVARVEDASVARCPDCDCEWPLAEHRQSALVIDLLLEQRGRARREFVNL